MGFPCGEFRGRDRGVTWLFSPIDGGRSAIACSCVRRSARPSRVLPRRPMPNRPHPRRRRGSSLQAEPPLAPEPAPPASTTQDNSVSAAPAGSQPTEPATVGGQLRQHRRLPIAAQLGRQRRPAMASAPSGDAPPPSGDAPPPSGDAPPPSGDAPPPSGDAPPPSSAGDAAPACVAAPAPAPGAGDGERRGRRHRRTPGLDRSPRRHGGLPRERRRGSSRRASRRGTSCPGSKSGVDGHGLRAGAGCPGVRAATA